MSKQEDRISLLKKKARRFIRQAPVKYIELNAFELPTTGGIYLLTLLYKDKELPLYINFCNNLQLETGTQQIVQQILIQNNNLVWLEKLKAEVLNQQEAKEYIEENLYFRYMTEPDVKEQMALTVTIVNLLKPWYINN